MKHQYTVSLGSNSVDEAINRVQSMDLPIGYSLVSVKRYYNHGLTVEVEISSRAPFGVFYLKLREVTGGYVDGPKVID